jgi:hypothetical protein
MQARRDRCRPKACQKEKRDQREEQQGDLSPCLSVEGKPRGDGVGIGIAGQEQELEDKKACSPHRWCATEERQDLLAEEQLDLKEQKGAEKDGCGKKKLAAKPRWPTRVDRIERTAWRVLKGLAFHGGRHGLVCGDTASFDASTKPASFRGVRALRCV